MAVGKAAAAKGVRGAVSVLVVAVGVVRGPAGSARANGGVSGKTRGRTASDRPSERTDRALGIHAGSAVCCFRGVGSRGVAARTSGTHGGVAPPRTHGVQGHSASEREGNRAVSGVRGRIPGCLYVA